MDEVKVLLWRRGRGLLTKKFTYISKLNSPYFSSPGWYHSSGRGRMYRLTIDHDYPDKPIWLGYRRRKKWVNVEGLYEVLLVVHKNFFMANKNFKSKSTGRSRSESRLNSTGGSISINSRHMILMAMKQAGLKWNGDLNHTTSLDLKSISKSQ